MQANATIGEGFHRADIEIGLDGCLRFRPGFGEGAKADTRGPSRR
jgi:hypothetical protein